MSKIIVCIPHKASLNPKLLERCKFMASQLPANNPQHEIEIRYNNRSVPTIPGERVLPWTKVYKARNQMLDEIDFDKCDYLLFIDADVVDYPLDMPTRLIECNPNGITAPWVMIEDDKRFYDTAAFILLGQDCISPDTYRPIPGRNVLNDPPHFPECKPTGLVKLACVGTITMVPSWLYKKGIRYDNHPGFTDHYVFCKACREAGHDVICNMDVTAYHANLPKYGENWH